MATEKRRITAIPDLDALAVLGYTLDEDGATLCAVGPAQRLARLVERASRELEAVLDRGEWNAIADVMNGCADLFDYAESTVPALTLLVANLRDGDLLNGLGRKWSVDVPDMSRRLEALTPTHGEAILCAVRWAWRHTEAWDQDRDPWWRPSFRRDHAARDR